MLHHFLTRLIRPLLVSSFLLIGSIAHANSGAISILHPDTGEWCLFGLEFEAPDFVLNKTGRVALELRNLSQCSLAGLELTNKLPKKARYFGAQPRATEAKDPPGSEGPIIRWASLFLPPRAKASFTIDVQLTRLPNGELRDYFCLTTRNYAEEEYCTYFRLKILP